VTSAAFAQPENQHSFAPVPFIAPPRPTLPTWQIAEWSAHVIKCVRDYGPTRNKIAVVVTIGRDGMIVSEPKIESPLDSDEFRADVKRVIAKLHQCEPLIVDPFGKFKGPFIQAFHFPPDEFDPDVEILLRHHFSECWKRPQTGPNVAVELHYKPDGTFAELRPLNPDRTAAYSEAVAEVIRQMKGCPPLKFSPDEYSEVQKFTWTFLTIESAAVYEAGQPHEK
jgi:hypothetical protein